MRRLFEKTKKHYALKQNLFTATKKLTIVPVSHWLENLERQSFLKNNRIITIHNGIDISVFKPTDSVEVRKKYGIGDGKYVIGVSSVWLPYKGWNDFMELSRIMPEGMTLVMVGLKSEQVEEASKNGILGIPRTENVTELAALYSGASLFCNLTYEDNYPTTNLEAMACGTPVLTYQTGGSPEAVTSETGWVVEQGKLELVASAIDDWAWKIRKDPNVEIEMRHRCRDRAEKDFDREDCFAEYLKLYEELLAR